MPSTELFLAGTEDHDLRRLSEYREVGGYAALEKARAMEPQAVMGEITGATLRAIECAGGCGRAPVVVIDERYHEPLRPDDVPEVVERLRGD